MRLGFFVTVAGWLFMLGALAYLLLTSSTDEEFWCRKERPNLTFTECAKEFGY